MCGRYSLTKKELRIVSKLSPGDLQLFFKERFNIAPTQIVPVILAENGQIVSREIRWGLQPKWASYPIINAKAETLLQKAMFRDSFQSRRCLVPADGFYEWRKPDKTPFRFVLPNREPFCFAGIWDWSHVNGREAAVETFAILTTDAAVEVRPYHDRMPLIIAPENYDEWLGDGEKAKELLSRPFPKTLEVYPVSSLVNQAANEDPRCIEPAKGQLL